jgi:hypothetical protein
LIVNTRSLAGGRHLYATSDGKDLGLVPELPVEPDQVRVPPEIGPNGIVYLGRGCPGRG